MEVFMDEFYLWILILIVTLYLLKYCCSGTYMDSDTLLYGKNVIVTGANSGIGYETAVECAKRGARVILACRNFNRGLEAERKIKLLSGWKVQFIPLDLSSFSSIRDFVDEIKKRKIGINFLVNNAGVFWVPYMKTKEGFESNFGVNYLGHFLLTLLLLPLMKDSIPSKVINVVSIMHAFGEVNTDELYSNQKSYNFVKAYSDSKLANVLFTKELSKYLREKDSQTHVYSADPGIVSTEIGSDSFFMGSFIYRIVLQPLVWLLFKKSDGGAQTILHCICSKNLVNGAYYSECSVRKEWPSAMDESKAKSLWEKSLELCELNVNELMELEKATGIEIVFCH